MNFNWINKQNNEDDILAEDVNTLAAGIQEADAAISALDTTVSQLQEKVDPLPNCHIVQDTGTLRVISVDDYLELSDTTVNGFFTVTGQNMSVETDINLIAGKMSGFSKLSAMAAKIIELQGGITTANTDITNLKAKVDPMPTFTVDDNVYMTADFITIDNSFYINEDLHIGQTIYLGNDISFGNSIPGFVSLSEMAQQINDNTDTINTLQSNVTSMETTLEAMNTALGTLTDELDEVNGVTT